MLKVTLITAEGKTICQCFEAEYHTLFRCRVPDTIQLRLYKAAPAETLESLLRSGQIDEDMDRSDLPSDLRDKLEPGELVTTLYVPTSFAVQITPCEKAGEDSKAQAAYHAIYSKTRNLWYDHVHDKFIAARLVYCEFPSEAGASNAVQRLRDDEEEGSPDEDFVVVPLSSMLQ